MSPVVRTAAPGRSAPSSRPIPSSARTNRLVRIAVAMPTGTLMKKIQCQLMASVSTPPASRPIDPPAEATNPKTPIAFACSRGSGNIFTIIAEHHRRGQGAAGALHEARADQHALALREGAQHRRGREDGEADQEDPALADQVAEAAGQQQQAAERDQVGVHHPRQVALGEVEVVLDRGQRDVHDRRVDHDHQHARAQHVERYPAGAIGLGRSGGWACRSSVALASVRCVGSWGDVAP